MNESTTPIDHSYFMNEDSMNAYMVRSTMMRECIYGCPLRAHMDSLIDDDHTTPTGWFILGTAVHDLIYQNLIGTVHDEDMQSVLEMRLINQLEENAANIVFSKARPTPEANVEAGAEIVETFLDLKARHPLFRSTELAEAELLMESVADGAYSTLDSLLKVKDSEALGFMGYAPGTEYVIVDWKTGSTASAQPAQLWFYYWLARKTGAIPWDTPFAGAFVHLSHGRVEAVTFYPGDEVIETWKTVVQELAAQNLWYPKPGWYCRLCSHQSVCPMIERP